MGVLLQAIGFGIASGSIIALAAVGFTVQYSISNILNVAYGSLMTLSAYCGYILITNKINIWFALTVVALAMGIASVILNRWLFTPLLRRSGGWVIVAIATSYVGIIIQFAILIVAGPMPRSYGQQSGSTVHLLGFILTSTQILLIGMTILVMLSLRILLTGTKLGRAMRATSGNTTLARACGIRTDRIVDVTWLLTGMLCGMAGVALAMTTVEINAGMGLTFLIYVIAAAALGGFGHPYGAMVGGLIVGIATQVSATYWSPALQDVTALSILIVVMLLRPGGLFTVEGSIGYLRRRIRSYSSRASVNYAGPNSAIESRRIR